MIPLRCMQSNSMVAIKHERSLDFLDGALDSAQKTVTCLEGPWSHSSNTKGFCVPQIKLRWGQIPLHWIQNILISPSNMTSFLKSFRQLQKFPKDTVPSLEEHQIQHSFRGKLHVPQNLSE